MITSEQVQAATAVAGTAGSQFFRGGRRPSNAGEAAYFEGCEMKMDKPVRSSFGKRHLDHVAIAWSGKPSVDSIRAVFEDIKAAMDASNDGRTNLTQVMVNTPAHVEGRIWILVNSAGLFSAHCTAAAAAQAQAISGGKVREFKLNSANKAAGGDLQKAQIAAIKAAHAAPQSLSLLKNRS
jgi:hypothetical protein